VSVPGALPAVHMQDLTGDKPRALQVGDRLGDITHFAHTPHRVQLPQCSVGVFAMHRRLDDARAYRVHSNAAFGVFNRQGFGRGIQPAFGEAGEYRRHAVDGVIDQAGGHIDDVAGAVFFHLGDGQLSDVEKAVEVHCQHVGVVVLGVGGEGFGDEDAGVVDQAVDTPEGGQGFADDALGSGRVGDVAGHREDVRVGGWLNRTRGGNHTVIEGAVGLDHGGADTLGGTGDDHDFAHCVSPVRAWDLRYSVVVMPA